MVLGKRFIRRLRAALTLTLVGGRPGSPERPNSRLGWSFSFPLSSFVIWDVHLLMRGR